MASRILYSPRASCSAKANFELGKYSTVELRRDTAGTLHALIRLKRDHPSEMLISLAHELGHLLAVAFRLPAAMSDPRLTTNIVGRRAPKRLSRSNSKQRILDAEIEAWELAERILPWIPIEIIENDLESYGMEWRK